MNIGKRWVVLALTLTMIVFAVGMGTQVQATNVAGTGQPNAVVAQVRADAEDITVDTLVVSHALTAFADDKVPASRAAKLAIAQAHVASASAIAGAIPDQAMTAVGSTTNVRDSIVRTLTALAAEVDATIACEKVKTSSCGAPAMVTRQSQAGSAAGASVVELMKAVNMDRKFVAAASAIIEQDLALAGVTVLDTAQLRTQAISLAPNMKVQTATPPAPGPIQGPPAGPPSGAPTVAKVP